MIKKYFIPVFFIIISILSLFIINTVLSQGHCQFFTNPPFFKWINLSVYLLWSLTFPFFYYLSIRKVWLLFKTKNENVNIELIIWVIISNIMSPFLFFDFYVAFVTSFENYL